MVLRIGILGSVMVAPRRAMKFDVTSQVLASHELAAGQQIELSGADALLLRGRHE